MKRLLLFLFLCAPSAFGQIAFDAAADGGDNGSSTTTLSWSHTASGSDRVGFVECIGDNVSGGVDDLTGVTWNSAPMTLAQKYGPSATLNRWLYVFVLAAPSTGSQTLVATASTTHFITCASVSYTGAGQTAIIGTPSTNVTAMVADNVLATSVTTVSDNSWVLIFETGYDSNQSDDPNDGPRRVRFSSFGLGGIFDTGGAVTPPQAGSYTTLRNNGTVLSNIIHIALELKLAGSPPPSTAVPFVFVAQK